MNTALADKISPQRNRDRGAILMVVLIVMVALLGLGMTGLFLTSGSIQMNSNINLRNQALVVAEAGLERAQAILNNKALNPNLPALLAPAVSNPSDEPIQDSNQCQGERRGAIFRDNGTPLVDIAYAPLNRTSDLPGTGAMSGGALVVSTTMGKYTVYVRQDTRDCRMGNFTCDIAPSVDGGIEACATPPPAGVPPNGAVVLRSEGVASDGRTRVVLEVTMSPSHGVGLGAGAPLTALCASGANGCDDNTSVQNGIVVTSPGPSNGGASGNGAGGTAGPGGSGAGGNGNGGAFGTMPGAGGAGGGAGAAGVPATGGASGGGTGGSACPGKYGARVAIMGVYGVWNIFGAGSSNDSGSAMFREWLDKNFGSCQPIGSITDFGNGRLTKEDLDPYNVIIALDLFHTNADRWDCVSHWSTGCSNGGGHYCYSASGFPPSCTPPCTSCSTGSYMVGKQPLLNATEIGYITDWLKKGNGLVSTIGYYYDAPQTGNINKILGQIGLAYKTNADGTVIKVLEPNTGNGVDLCAAVASGDPLCPGGSDFRSVDTPGHYPFDFVNPVNRLEVRGAVPIVTVSQPITATVKLSARAKCGRSIQTSNRCNASLPAACDGAVAAPQDVGYTAEDIGGTSSGGRVVAWGDEWLTYNTLWSSLTDDVYDKDGSGNPLPTCSPRPPYKVAEFWENVIAWLAVNHQF